MFRQLSSGNDSGVVLRTISGTASGTNLGAEQFQILVQELSSGIMLGIAFRADLGAERFQVLFWGVLLGFILGLAFRS